MDMQTYRRQLDDINKTMAQLFEQRMEICGEIAQYKQAHHLPVFDSAREREILNEVTAQVAPQFSTHTGVLFQTLFDLSRSYQRHCTAAPSELCTLIDSVTTHTPKMRPERAVVACQGVEGAYSQHACDRMFKHPTIIYLSQFEDVFKAVERGECRYGVLPVENSTAGSVNAVYDLMSKYRFYITHSLRLFISHALLAKPQTDRSQITTIYSHEQALRQCSRYIESLGAKGEICKNTAQAAQFVSQSERDDVAAIGSPDCAALYGLKMLDTGIQNVQNNYTRFICISKMPEIYPGAKKTSIMLRLDHHPGALYHMIARFAALDLNLTKLESRPIAGTDFQFMFYFDVEESVYSPALKALIAELERDSTSFTYLGSYTEE